MSKRFQLYIGVVILMIVLIILSVIFDNPYHVFLMDNASDMQIFAAGAPTVELLGNVSADSANGLPDAQKALTFEEDSINIHLNEMLSHEMLAYTSEDNKITCWFSAEGDKLRLISAEDWFSSPQGSNITEEDCLRWIYDRVAVYYTENWDDYTLSCSTVILSTADGKPQQFERNGFLVAPSEQETISAYVFTFTKSLDTQETTDLIQAYIRPDNGFAAIEFSAHNFDDAKPVSVSTDKLEDAVGRFIRKYIDKTKYTYAEHEIHHPKLSYISGKLCFICTVSIRVAFGDETLNIQQQLAVTLK